MAEAEIDMAGNKGKQMKESLRSGKQKKSGKKNTSNDDELTCSKCTKVFLDINDKLLACERCDRWFCTECIDMSDEVYKIMNDRKDMHWYCSECEVQAVTAVQTDKDIEDKCAAYMKTITDRLDKMNKKIDDKAEKESVDQLESRVKNLEDKQENHQKENSESASGVKQSSNTVKETIDEQREREYRAKNIVIHNLPESKCKEIEDRMKEDKSRVMILLEILEVLEEDEDPIEWCSRIGQRDEKGDKMRVTKVTLETVDVKRRILKKSRSLKDKEDYEEIFVSPDLTFMQRKEQYELRKELNARKAKGEKDIFIRRGQVVKARERATWFKGGATTSSADTE